MPIIPALERQRQEDYKSQTSLGYGMRLHLEKKIVRIMSDFVTVITAV